MPTRPTSPLARWKTARWTHTTHTFPTRCRESPIYMPPLDAWLPGGVSSLSAVFATHGSWVGPQWEADDVE